LVISRRSPSMIATIDPFNASISSPGRFCRAQPARVAALDLLEAAVHRGLPRPTS
jgi:hypothetical protein